MNGSMQTAEPAIGALDGGVPVLSPLRQAAVLALPSASRSHPRHPSFATARPMNKIVPLIVQGFSCELAPRYIQLILAGCPIV